MKSLILGLILTLVAGCAASHQVRYPATRWIMDNDRKPIELPSKNKQYTYSAAINYMFFYQLERLVDLELRAEHGLHSVGFSTLQEALNTNNFDEVADSTWFTNRLGRNPMSLEELRRGPNRSAGPDPKGPWTLVSAKSAGVSPGMVIEDQRGDKYVIKFDPPGHLGLGTAAEVIGTKMVHAFGYYVPETYIVTFHPKILTVPPKATTKDSSGKDSSFTPENLDEL